jgi:hypothetical protein
MTALAEGNQVRRIAISGITIQMMDSENVTGRGIMNVTTMLAEIT